MHELRADRAGHKQQGRARLLPPTWAALAIGAIGLKPPLLRRAEAEQREGGGDRQKRYLRHCFDRRSSCVRAQREGKGAGNADAARGGGLGLANGGRRPAAGPA
jgi:hypothetical protein